MPEPSPEAVEDLFQQAADLAPERRGAFLDERCGGDLDLRAAVEELLRFDAQARGAADFLRSPAVQVRVAELAEAFLERYRRGERPDVEEYAAAWPCARWSGTGDTSAPGS